MAVMKWAPFQELDSIERRMRRAFEEFGFAPTLLPAADVFETADEFVVEVEVPGYAEEELHVEISDHTLTVKGERSESREKQEKTFRLHERLDREFERRFALPPEADTEHVRATFAKGVLELHAPKLATATPRKVEIAQS